MCVCVLRSHSVSFGCEWASVVYDDSRRAVWAMSVYVYGLPAPGVPTAHTGWRVRMCVYGMQQLPSPHPHTHTHVAATAPPISCTRDIYICGMSDNVHVMCVSVELARSAANVRRNPSGTDSHVRPHHAVVPPVSSVPPPPRSADGLCRTHASLSMICSLR